MAADPAHSLQCPVGLGACSIAEPIGPKREVLGPLEVEKPLPRQSVPKLLIPAVPISSTPVTPMMQLSALLVLGGLVLEL